MSIQIVSLSVMLLCLSVTWAQDVPAVITTLTPTDLTTTTNTDIHLPGEGGEGLGIFR